jgi:hypothetical protein
VFGLETGVGVDEHPLGLQARMAGYVGRRTIGEFAGLLRKAAHRRQANTTLALGRVAGGVAGGNRTLRLLQRIYVVASRDDVSRSKA